MAALVIAHRGARSLAPENTLAAAMEGLTAGADLWETDVSLTCDGHLILFHDEQLSRCTDFKNRYPGQRSDLVRDYSFEQIRQLDAGSYFFRSDPFNTIADGHVAPGKKKLFSTLAVPSLKEGLIWTLQNRWQINLELKYFPAGRTDTFLPDGVLKELASLHFPLDHLVISSFHHPWLHHVRQTVPEIKVQALMGDDMNRALDFKDYFFDTYNINAAMVDAQLISKLKSMGKTVNLFTVNDPALFARFEQMGVDGMFTDFPQRFCRS